MDQSNGSDRGMDRIRELFKQARMIVDAARVPDQFDRTAVPMFDMRAGAVNYVPDGLVFVGIDTAIAASDPKPKDVNPEAYERAMERVNAHQIAMNDARRVELPVTPEMIEAGLDACCRERTQLHMAATLHPLPEVRIAATVAFNALIAVHDGMYGGVTVANLFD